MFTVWYKSVTSLSCVGAVYYTCTYLITHYRYFRYKYFPNRRGGVAGFGQAPATRRRPDDNNGGGRHAWGQGNTLGN